MNTPPEIYWLLVNAGWQQQDIPGLWRHPWKAQGSELTTMQALQANDEQPSIVDLVVRDLID